MPNPILSHTYRATLAASLMLAGAAGSAVAGPLEDQGDYATVYRLVLPLAEHGNAGAQAMLGEMYANPTKLWKRRLENWKAQRKAWRLRFPLD
ncbi:MAG: hypothetical protein WAK55_14600 [Xanthobacteraceae bacterium]